MKTLEELAPSHGNELRLRFVLQAPGHFSGGIAAIGMSTPLLGAVIIKPALYSIQLCPESLESIELVKIGEKWLVRR